MSGCEIWHELRFCTNSNVFMLGDNFTKKSGLANSSFCPTLVIIPPNVNGKEVREIGAYALSDCPLIKEIIINARITQINSHAFFASASLEKINIPNTCLYILDSALDFWNQSLGDHITNPGTSKVFFEPNSKIAFIDNHGISYRENVHIYFCSAVSPRLHKYAFAVTSNVVVYSRVSFIFNGKRTNTSNYSSLCSMPRTCPRPNSRNLGTMLYVYVLLVSS